jgi:exopolyphosphatase/guanosine-5'-triphosphate,3'-diphosphate pyrophosphatase
MTRTVGVIDLGSNSVRLAVVRTGPGGALRVAATAKSVVRLAAGQAEGSSLDRAGLERTVAAVSDFVRIGRTHGVAEYLAVATAAVRQAANGEAFVQAVSEQTGVAFRIISEAEESELAFLGAMNTLAETDGLLVDMGGASTELVRFTDRRVDVAVSLPFGAVNLTERFLPGGTGNNDGYNQLLAFLAELLARVPWIRSARGLPLIGVGGTVRNLAKMDRRSRAYPLEELHNYRMEPDRVEAVYRLVRGKTPQERTRIPGLSEDRADIIASGAAMFWRLLTRSGARELVVSGAGVREGLVYRHVLGGQTAPPVADVLEHSAASLLEAYGLDEQRSRETARLALVLYDRLQPLHGLAPWCRRCLWAGATLAEVGAAVNLYGQDHHTFYLLCHGRLYGLSHRETVITAAVAGFEGSGKARALIGPLESLLHDGDELAVRRLGVICAMARALTLYEPGAVQDLTVEVLSDRVTVRIQSHALTPGEVRSLQGLADDFRKAFGARLLAEG